MVGSVLALSHVVLWRYLFLSGVGELIDEVFQAAIKPGTIESFGRPQQNTITQWSQSLKVGGGEGWSVVG